MKKLLLSAFIIISLISCNKKEEVPEITQEEINLEKMDSLEKKADSVAKIRREEDYNSINYTSRNRTYFRPTIDFDAGDLYRMSRMSVIELQDFLVDNNWTLV